MAWQTGDDPEPGEQRMVFYSPQEQHELAEFYDWGPERVPVADVQVWTGAEWDSVSTLQPADMRAAQGEPIIRPGDWGQR